MLLSVQDSEGVFLEVVPAVAELLVEDTSQEDIKEHKLDDTEELGQQLEHTSASNKQLHMMVSALKQKIETEEQSERIMEHEL